MGEKDKHTQNYKRDFARGQNDEKYTEIEESPSPSVKKKWRQCSDARK